MGRMEGLSRLAGPIGERPAAVAVVADGIEAIVVGEGCLRRDLPAPPGARAWLMEMAPGSEWPRMDRHDTGEAYFVLERVMYFFMCRVAQPVASRQGSVAQPWLAAKASHGPQDRHHRGATRREGRLRARSGVAHLAKATSLGGGARLGSGPQTAFAAYQKAHNTL